jgi:hypothetical protein
MTIIQDVRDVLEANAGTAMTTAEIEASLKGVTKSQINSALWRLRTEEDLIKQVRTGLHKYLGPTERPIDYSQKNARNTVAEAARVGSVSDAIKDDEAAQDKFFTQVGTAKNGDLLITRDSDGAAFRATPL